MSVVVVSVTIDDLTRDTLSLACRYARMRDPEAVLLFEDKGIMDFVHTSDGGWLCRAFPAMEGGSIAIVVPDVSGIKGTMAEAVIALNLWLTSEMARYQRAGVS